MESYASYYQKRYKKENKEKIKVMRMKLYNLYKSEYIPCLFCSNIIQISDHSRHLKSKRCKEMQDMVPNKTELMLEFRKQLNQTRASLRLGLDEENDTNTSQDKTLSVG